MNPGSLRIDYDEAVRKINDITPDLILLDIMLKDGSSGYKIAHYANQKAIPVIFITASTHASDYRMAEGYNPAAILHKPVSEDQLKETVENILGKHTQS